MLNTNFMNFLLLQPSLLYRNTNRSPTFNKHLFNSLNNLLFLFFPFLVMSQKPSSCWLLMPITADKYNLMYLCKCNLTEKKTNDIKLLIQSYLPGASFCSC